MEFIKQLQQQVSNFWQQRNREQKIRFILILGLILGTSILAILFFTRPQYAELYSGLNAKDAGEIIKILEENKIDYKLEDNGQTILIDPSKVYKTRLMLAQEGLPSGGNIGFSDILGQTRLGITDWERQVQYNQALQGELARTIEEMEEVISARVHIVQPENSLFIEPEKNFEASCAVFLNLAPGSELDDEAISAIINLISHSVKGLKAENITVIDNHGRVLSNGISSEEQQSKDMIYSQLQIQKDFQQQLQSSVQSLLEQVFGPGNVAVRVHAELNFDKKTVENKFFTPVDEETGEGIVRSIDELKEHFSGSGAAAQGNPGVDSNIPGYPQDDSQNSNYEKTSIIKNYEINESYEMLTVAPGAVNKLSVSVVINRELNEDEKQSISQIVGNAIGLVPERDQISVEGMTFDNSLINAFAAQEASLREKNKLQPVWYVAVAAVLALMIFFAIRALRKRSQMTKDERLAVEIAQAQQAAAQIEKEIEPKDEAQINLEKYARRQPEDVAKIIRTWLNED